MRSLTHFRKIAKNHLFRMAFLAVVAFYSSTVEVQAQCAVCRASAESNIDKKENKVGRGLNQGILYLMAVPYIKGGLAFLIWYKQKRKMA